MVNSFAFSYGDRKNFCASGPWSDVSSHRFSIVDLWSYLVPAGLTTPVSTVIGRNLSALCRSVGTTFGKEPYWGQIAFTQIYLWRGGLSPFLFANFSVDINQYTW